MCATFMLLAYENPLQHAPQIKATHLFFPLQQLSIVNSS